MKKFRFILAMLAVVLALSLAFTACGGDDGIPSTPGGSGAGDGSNGNKIMGLSYSMKLDHKDYFMSDVNDWTGEVTSYFLEHSFDEAFEILTKQLGEWNLQVNRPTGVSVNQLTDYNNGNPYWVVLQDRQDWGDYSLFYKYTPNDPNDLWADGFYFDKPFDKEGTLRITGIPDEYIGKHIEFSIWDNLWWACPVASFNYPYGELREIKNSSIEMPLWWFQHKTRYDRKNGTFNRGGRYGIYLDFLEPDFTGYSAVAYSFPSITFVNGHAELDFNTGKEDPDRNVFGPGK